MAANKILDQDELDFLLRGIRPAARAGTPAAPAPGKAPRPQAQAAQATAPDPAAQDRAAAAQTAPAAPATSAKGPATHLAGDGILHPALASALLRFCHLWSGDLRERAGFFLWLEPAGSRLAPWGEVRAALGRGRVVLPVDLDPDVGRLLLCLPQREAGMLVETGLGAPRPSRATARPGDDGVRAPDPLDLRILDAMLAPVPDILARACEPFFLAPESGPMSADGGALLALDAKEEVLCVTFRMETPASGGSLLMVLPCAAMGRLQEGLARMPGGFGRRP